MENYNSVKNNNTSVNEIHDALSDSVHRQLMSDVPYGVHYQWFRFFITPALAKKFSAKRVETGDTCIWWPQLHSFSVGLEGSPDLKAAKRVAKHIGTIHHEIKFTIQEDYAYEVIYHLETYDITTIRALHQCT